MSVVWFLNKVTFINCLVLVGKKKSWTSVVWLLNKTTLIEQVGFSKSKIFSLPWSSCFLNEWLLLPFFLWIYWINLWLNCKKEDNYAVKNDLWLFWMWHIWIWKPQSFILSHRTKVVVNPLCLLSHDSSLSGPSGLLGCFLSSAGNRSGRGAGDHFYKGSRTYGHQSRSADPRRATGWPNWDLC